MPNSQSHELIILKKKLDLTWYFSLEIKTAKLKKISVDIKLEHTKFKL